MNKNCLIIYLSSTAAQGAAAILRRRSIPCEVTKPPSSLTGGSCSYALSFNSRYLPRVRELVATGGGIYCRGETGLRRIN